MCVTVIPNDILKLVDKDGKELKSFEWVEVGNPNVLINPEIGHKYETEPFYLWNSSEWKIHHIKWHHSYSDVKIEPSYIDSLKKHKSIPIKIVWRPFSEKGISEKCKDGKISLSISPHAVVEIIQEVNQ
jgi:hypothetical protein